MKIKKRYIIACVLLCIVSVLISIGVFYMEMSLAKYSKLSDVLSSTWSNTELFVTQVATPDTEISKDVKVPFGNVTYIVNGKYTAYNKDYWLNGDVAYFGEAKLGDKLNAYYKPDYPEKLMTKPDFTIYIIALGVLLVLDIALIVVARLLNKSLRDNTFSDAPVSIMDIPICVLVAGFVICFFMGMFTGNISVDASYTSVNKIIAEDYNMTANQYVYSEGSSSATDDDSADSSEEGTEETEEEAAEE